MKLNKIFLILVLVFLTRCARTTFVGHLESTRTRREPLDVTEVKTDKMILKAYGRFKAPQKDSVYVRVLDGKRYVKFGSSDDSYLVNDKD